MKPLPQCKDTRGTPLPQEPLTRVDGGSGDHGEHPEAGQILVVCGAGVVLCLLLALTVIAVSAVYIEHKRLLSVADGAAAASAGTFVLRGEDAVVPGTLLDHDSVLIAAEKYLELSGEAEHFTGLRIEAASGTPDGRTAEIVLRAEVSLPLLAEFMPADVEIHASSRARVELVR